MERRKKERRHKSDPKPDAISALHLARSLLSQTEQYRRHASKISEIIDDIEDTTQTINRRREERRDVPTVRLRAVG